MNFKPLFIGVIVESCGMFQKEEGHMEYNW